MAQKKKKKRGPGRPPSKVKRQPVGYRLRPDTVEVVGEWREGLRSYLEVIGVDSDRAIVELMIKFLDRMEKEKKIQKRDILP